MDESCPEQANVNQLGCYVEPLILREGCAAFAFCGIDEPVENEFGQSENGVSADEPDETCVDEAVSAHQVNPQIGGSCLAVREGRRRGVAILAPGQEISLEREIREGMANYKGEKKNKCGEQSVGRAEGECQRLKHTGMGIPLVSRSPHTIDGGSEKPSKRIKHGLACHGNFLVGFAEALTQLGGHIDEETSGGAGMRLQILLETTAVDSPDFGKRLADDARAGFARVEHVDFSDRVACLEGSEEHGATRYQSLHVKGSRDHHEKGVLLVTFVNEDLSIVKRDEFAKISQLSAFLDVEIRGESHFWKDGVRHIG